MKYQAFVQRIWQRATLAGVLSGILIHSSLALSAQPLPLSPSIGAVVVGIVAHTQKCSREHPAMANEMHAGMQGWIGRHNEAYTIVAKSGDLAQWVIDAEKSYADHNVKFSRSDCEHILMTMKNY